jgi:hypothetical protein
MAASFKLVNAITAVREYPDIPVSDCEAKPKNFAG